MSLNPELLRSSFELIIERQPAITPRFYVLLFERYPQVRPLFGRNSGRAQEEMLQQALVAVLDHLEDAAWLAATLGKLGAGHVEYGVTREMFDWVGDALLSTLAEVAKEAWTAEVAHAWQDAYAAVRDLMLAGMTMPVITLASATTLADVA